MKRRFLVAAALIISVGDGAGAQFSSDIPGVPRAAISIRGGHQNRTEWTFSGYKVPSGGTSSGDSLAGGLRVGFGQSYRILGQFELGYDFTLFDAYGMQPPSAKSVTGSTAAPTRTYIRGLAAYGIRIGAKYRPIVALDPDGNGYEVAFGMSLQPELRPLYGIEHLGDSLRQGGQFAGEKTGPRSTFFQSNPFAKLSSATDFAAMGSYRSRRIIADGAIVMERVPTRDVGLDPSPVGLEDGVSLRAGGAYRVGPSFAVGASFWSQGSAPWRDDVHLSVPGKQSDDHFALLLQFGSAPEAGIDVMYSAPTGKYNESGRLYVRLRSTR